MEFNNNLFNAAVIAENGEMSFIAEGNHLHAVDEHVAIFKKDKSDPAIVLPLMREGYKALLDFAQGKVPAAFTSNEHTISLKPEEYDQLIEKIVNLYTHLPHKDRLYLSSMIHHAQSSTHS